MKLQKSCEKNGIIRGRANIALEDLCVIIYGVHENYVFSALYKYLGGKEIQYEKTLPACNDQQA